MANDGAGDQQATGLIGGTSKSDYSRLLHATKNYEASRARARQTLRQHLDTYLSAVLTEQLVDTPVSRLEQYGVRSFDVGSLSFAGFTNVAQVAAVKTADLTKYRGIDSSAALSIQRAVKSLRAEAWRLLHDSKPAIESAPGAAALRAYAGIVARMDELHIEVGPAVREVQDLAQQGRAATIMARRSMTRNARKQRAASALGFADLAYAQLARDGLVTKIEWVSSPSVDATSPIHDRAQLERLIAAEPVMPSTVEGSSVESLATWRESRASGAAPKIRVTHPVAWPMSAAGGLLALSFMASVAGAVSESSVAAAATTEAPVSMPAPETPLVTPSAEPSTEPVFDLLAAQDDNAAYEQATRAAWTAGYEEATTGDAIAAESSESLEVYGTVTYVIDGDTVILATGEHVRVIGVDAPERGECGADQARVNAVAHLEGKRVSIVEVVGEPETDRYGRLLRYIELTDGTDFGLMQIERGLAAARYDGYDGYTPHPRQDAYHSADDAIEHICGDENPVRQSVIIAAAVPEPEPQAPAGIAQVPAPQPAPESKPEENEPWNQPGPDLDCKDIGHRVIVYPPDYHKLDRDGDGIGCESWG